MRSCVAAYFLKKSQPKGLHKSLIHATELNSA
jgi:hypothetical protein